VPKPLICNKKNVIQNLLFKKLITNFGTCELVWLGAPDPDRSADAEVYYYLNATRAHGHAQGAASGL
jgi:hypothetical protein